MGTSLAGSGNAHPGTPIAGLETHIKKSMNTLMGEDCESQHLAAKKESVQKLPEARWRDQTKRSVRHTRSHGGAEHAISKVPVEGVHAKFRGR